MCTFCRRIESKNEHKNGPFWERSTAIVINENNDYELWIEVDDSYYSGSYLIGIDYCPMCGRKLKKEEE